MPPIRAAERRRKQNRADARRTILDASEALLLEVGHEGFSIRRLVERSGYSAPTIYHYFGDKNGLVDALLEERLLAELIENQRAVPHLADPFDEALARSEAFARWGMERPSQYRLLTMQRGDAPRPLPSGEEALALMQSPYERLVEAGRLAPDDVESLSQSVWACLHGLISLRVIRPDVEWQPDLVRRSVAALLRGWFDRASTDSSALHTPEAPQDDAVPERRP